MKLDEKRLALACGILWGAVMLIMGLCNLVWHGYGQDFLRVMASVYPGYHAEANISQAIIGGIYGAVDGLVGGYIFGWMYNHVVPARS